MTLFPCMVANLPTQSDMASNVWRRRYTSRAANSVLRPSLQGGKCGRPDSVPALYTRTIGERSVRGSEAAATDAKTTVLQYGQPVFLCITATVLSGFPPGIPYLHLISKLLQFAAFILSDVALVGSRMDTPPESLLWPVGSCLKTVLAKHISEAFCLI